MIVGRRRAKRPLLYPTRLSLSQSCYLRTLMTVTRISCASSRHIVNADEREE